MQETQKSGQLAVVGADEKATHAPSTGLKFAVGCFHFGLVKSPPPNQLTVRDYVELVKDALNSVQTINNVVVKAQHDEQTFTVLDDPPEGLEEGEAYPFPHFFNVRFDVYIPLRIQSDVFKWRASASGTESFSVWITHAYDSPVAFIVPHPTDDDDTNPSDAVPVIREYLRREMNDGEGRPIRFESLGPSPLHADFHLVPDESVEGSFAISYTKGMGYADVRIAFNPNQFKNIQAAFEEVRYLMALEADVFYAIKQMESRQISAWIELQELMQSLTTGQESSLLGKAKSYLSRSRKLADLHHAVANFEATSIQSRHRASKLVRQIYENGNPELIKPMLDAAISEDEVYPIKQVGRLVDFMENRQSKAFELFVVLFAALVGGVAGSLVTLLGQGG